MPRIKDSKTLAAGAADKEDGRRPTIVSAAPAASPELLDRPRRRTFTAQDKLRILGEADRAAGAFEALSPAKRGPKTTEPNPLAAELALSRRDNLRLKQRLERAEAIIEIQKKVAVLLGLPASSE